MKRMRIVATSALVALLSEKLVGVIVEIGKYEWWYSPQI
jgi:hypothetical protein